MTLYVGAKLHLVKEDGTIYTDADNYAHHTFEVVEHGSLFDNKETFLLVKLRMVK